MSNSLKTINTAEAAHTSRTSATRQDVTASLTPAQLGAHLLKQRFPALQNDTFLRALRRQPTAYTPIWLMRQAGRYLPQYNATRARAGSFLNLAKTPDYATEVTLQPLAHFPLDAAILFSDILTIPDAMGLGLSFETGEGPRFAHPLQTEQTIQALSIPPIEDLDYVFQAVTQIRHELNGSVPLIGFAGSPWTLACYMVEGGASSDFRRIKTLLYQRPDLLHHILSINASAVAAYLNAQIAAGAQAVMIFDSWGGVLSSMAYQTFSLAYMRLVLSQIVQPEGLEPIPVILFTKGGGLWLNEIADSGCDAIGVDWTVNLAQARQQVGQRCAIQGNLDPMVLFAQPAQIRAESQRILDEYAFGGSHIPIVPEGPGFASEDCGMQCKEQNVDGSLTPSRLCNAAMRPQDRSQDSIFRYEGYIGHIFNLGHGISQYTPPDAVATLVDHVHTYSASLRK